MEGGISNATAQLARVFVVNNLVEKARITEKPVIRFFTCNFLGWPWCLLRRKKKKKVDGKSRLSVLTIYILPPFIHIRTRTSKGICVLAYLM